MKTAVVIGRFQPFHLGHMHMIEEACKIAEQVIIVIGDTGCARTAKDPWTFEERVEMIKASMPDLGWKARIVCVHDVPYDDEAWSSAVSAAIKPYANDLDDEIVLVGHNKDASSFYLKLFAWPLVEVPACTMSEGMIDATYIRKALFGVAGSAQLAAKMLPFGSHAVAIKMSTERAARIGDEMAAISEYELDSQSEISRRHGPQAAIAVDCLLRDHNHVLLIRRKGRVGKGTLALPGGFVDAGETLRQAAERELLEETGVDLAQLRAKGAVQEGPLVVGDAPGRSQRGRIVTLVHPYFISGASKRVTPVAGDDAKWAGWVSYKDIEKLKSEFFSDHYHLINVEKKVD